MIKLKPIPGAQNSYNISALTVQNDMWEPLNIKLYGLVDGLDRTVMRRVNIPAFTKKFKGVKTCLRLQVIPNLTVYI